MGRAYAGILGPLACSTVLLRGMLRGGGTVTTLQAAAIHLFVFALIGYIVGELAAWIVLDAVRGHISAELAAQQAVKVAPATVRPNGG